MMKYGRKLTHINKINIQLSFSQLVNLFPIPALLELRVFIDSYARRKTAVKSTQRTEKSLHSLWYYLIDRNQPEIILLHTRQKIKQEDGIFTESDRISLEVPGF